VNGSNVVSQRFISMYDSDVRSAVTGSNSSRVLKYRHTAVPCCRWTWYPTSHIIL